MRLTQKNKGLNKILAGAFLVGAIVSAQARAGALTEIGEDLSRAGAEAGGKGSGKAAGESLLHAGQVAGDAAKAAQGVSNLKKLKPVIQDGKAVPATQSAVKKPSTSTVVKKPAAPKPEVHQASTPAQKPTTTPAKSQTPVKKTSGISTASDLPDGLQCVPGAGGCAVKPTKFRATDRPVKTVNGKSTLLQPGENPLNYLEGAFEETNAGLSAEAKKAVGETKVKYVKNIPESAYAAGDVAPELHGKVAYDKDGNLLVSEEGAHDMAEVFDKDATKAARATKELDCCRLCNSVVALAVKPACVPVCESLGFKNGVYVEPAAALPGH